jgi:UDP-glucose 4-epimerase
MTLRALITGGLGYIGSATALKMRELGHDVMVVDDGRDSVWDPVTWSGPAVSFPLQQVIRRGIQEDGLGFQIRQFRPDVVFHFAASTSVGDAERDPAGYAENNVGALSRFLNLFPPDLKPKPRIVHASSAAVYAPMSDRIPEVAPRDPRSFYGKTKLMAEHLLEASAYNQQLTFVGLRYFNVVGKLSGIKERRKSEGHLVPRLAMAAETHLPFTLNGWDFQTPDGTAVRDYVDLADVVKANLLAMDALLASDYTTGILNDWFNIGSGVGTSVHEMIRMFQDVSGKDIQVTHGPRRHGDPARLVANIDRATRILGWSPKVPLVDSIRSVVHR